MNLLMIHGENLMDEFGVWSIGITSCESIVIVDLFQILLDHFL